MVIIIFSGLALVGLFLILTVAVFALRAYLAQTRRALLPLRYIDTTDEPHPLQPKVGDVYGFGRRVDLVICRVDSATVGLFYRGEENAITLADLTPLLVSAGLRPLGRVAVK